LVIYIIGNSVFKRLIIVLYCSQYRA